MNLDIVWNGGSGDERNVKKAFKAYDASGEFENRVVDRLDPNDLVIVYENDGPEPDGDLVKKDEETGQVWCYLEKGCVVGGEGNGVTVHTDEGRSGKADDFEYKDWTGEANYTVLDSGKKLSGEVVRVEK